MDVVIIEYGLGNTKSILNACKKITDNVVVTRDKDKIENATHLVCPGVGSFDYGMRLLKETKLADLIITHFNKNKPILGICLGLQIFFERSEEGKLPGLGLLNGEVIKIKKEFKCKERIPVIGWREVKLNDFNKNSTLSQTFYFDHSYMVSPENENIIEGYYFIDDLKINSFIKSKRSLL